MFYLKVEEKMLDPFSNVAFVLQITYFLVFLSIASVCVQAFKRELRTLNGCSISLMTSFSLYLCLLLGDSLAISFAIFVMVIVLVTNIVHDGMLFFKDLFIPLNRLQLPNR